MPPLEGLASGTPVVTSATTAIPEVVGNAGLLIDPTDVDALHAALEQLVSDANLRESLIERGLARAELFSWRKAAETMAIAFDENLARRKIVT